MPEKKKKQKSYLNRFGNTLRDRMLKGMSNKEMDKVEGVYLTPKEREGFEDGSGFLFKNKKKKEPK